ncbi:hypothetical protein QUF50_03735 [Thiotrichales bacterium HSG1]|nr:hypothetical protein [Thiotrichales bacterium HSG1]
MLIFTIILIGLLLPKILQKKLICYVIFLVLFGGMGLIAIPVNNVYCAELSSKDLKLIKTQKEQDCDPDDKDCNTEK